MAHSGPDWGVSESVSTIYKVDDLGELAARINVVNTFDRRGNVVWWDDFEDNLNKWYQSLVGTGAAAALSTDYARSGAKSAKLTTGNAVGNATILDRPMGLPNLTTKIGIEASFILDDPVILGVYGYLYRSGTYYLAVVRYSDLNNKLQYRDSAGDWQDIATGLVLDRDPTWHTIKLVFDATDTGEYVRVILNNTEYSLADIGMYSTTTAANDKLHVLLRVEAEVATNYNAYIDDAIITQNEP